MVGAAKVVRGVDLAKRQQKGTTHKVWKADCHIFLHRPVGAPNVCLHGCGYVFLSLVDAVLDNLCIFALQLCKPCFQQSEAGCGVMHGMLNVHFRRSFAWPQLPSDQVVASALQSRLRRQRTSEDPALLTSQ